MADTIKINAGFATIGQGAGPMIVTQRAGLFRKHGLEVDIRMMGGAVGVVRGLLEGAIQFGNLAAPALLEAVLRGAPEMVFLTGGINQQFVMSRPGIDRREQLAGGTMGIAGDAGLNDVLVRFALDQFEASGIRNISKVSLPSGEDARLEALVAGQCDAMVITPPTALIARRRGCAFIMDFGDYGLNYALGGLAARRDYVRANEEIIRRIVSAYVEGMHRYRTDREFTVTVQQEYSDIQDRAVAEETYDVTRPGMPPIPRPVPSALKTVLELIGRDLPAARNADPSRFIDDRFIRELEQSGFIAALSRAAS
jgi:ABC-type nitrate/sulfonate/bicarbonate transport system substrate-binding protein